LASQFQIVMTNEKPSTASGSFFVKPFWRLIS
jgi:hypothetical protein